MKEQFQQNQAELETLQRTQDELKQGKMKLNTILSRLEKEQVSWCCFIWALWLRKIQKFGARNKKKVV
jgi:hypothetical protein